MTNMERIQSINPSRILWCCADRGISPDELASELGIAAPTLQGVLDAQEGLTFNQLRKLAEFFGRGALFFLEPGPVDETRVHTPQFRTLANMKPELSPKLKSLIERVEKQRAIYLSLREDLDDADRPKFLPPQLPQRNPREAARIVRAWLNAGEQSSFDTYRAAIEAQGVLVFRTNGYTGQWQIAKENPILGFSLYDAACPIIVVKKQRWETQQVFTLAHELGHLLLHRTSSIDDEQDLQSRDGTEREANAFAGHLLVPDAFLKLIRDADRPADASQFEDWLSTERKKWGVSTEVILRRLLDAGRLEESAYAAYRQWRARIALTQRDDSGSREYRHREPKHVFGETYVRTVLQALSARKITLAKASTYLDSLKISDLHRLEQHLAGS